MSLDLRLPVRLAQPQLWEGLVRKAADPTRYISAITACTVLERYDDGLLREIVIHDSARQIERATYVPPDRVVFDQVTERHITRISNVIEKTEQGGLCLVLRIEGDMEILGNMRDYFTVTLQEIVDRLHRDAGVVA